MRSLKSKLGGGACRVSWERREIIAWDESHISHLPAEALLDPFYWRWGKSEKKRSCAS